MLFDLVNVGLPYTRVTTFEWGGELEEQVTSASGTYPYPGGLSTARLDGRHANIESACGTISASDSSGGDLDFGGAGTNTCAAGTAGGAGNTNASTANWDLAQSIGWSAFEELWFASLFPTKSAYQLATGEALCDPQAEVNGCGSQNWYTVYLAIDDDDGNLSNGTPNGCKIWDAFDAHGIACGSRPACSSDAPPMAAFPPPVCDALTCTFDASASSDDQGIVSYSWDFGDGTTGSGQVLNHIYSSPGSYPVTLTVTDTAGQTDTDVKNAEPQLPCEVTNFQVVSYMTGLPTVTWDTTCPETGVISVQVKTTTLSSMPEECSFYNALWDGNPSGSRTADYMAGGYGPSNTCPAVGQALFWLELRDTSDGNRVFQSTEYQTANYNPPPLPCELLSFSVANRGTGEPPVISGSTSCPNPGAVSVQVKTTTISQQPAGCELDAALWDGNKNGSRTADYMVGGYGANCPAVTHAQFWVELWDASQLLQRSSYRDASFTP